MYQIIPCVLTKRMNTHNVCLSLSGDMGIYVEVAGKNVQENASFFF